MHLSFYFFLITAFVAIAFITGWLFKSKFWTGRELKYTKVDLENCDTGLLTNSQFKEEVGQLIQNGYQLTSQQEVFDFVYHKNKLSDKSLVIIMDDTASVKVKSVMPFLLKRKVNVVFFMPFMLGL